MRSPLAGLLLATALIGASASAQQAALPGTKTARTPQGIGDVAKRAPINGVLVLYGNERCPTDTGGNEIVICERRGAEEQFRVPKELREFKVTPENESWAAKAQGTLDTGVGVSSMGSCSTVGAAGQTGCFAQQSRATRKANTDRKLAEAEGQ